MNIWIVNHYATPPSTGGSWVRHFYFSKYLRKKGHDVKIFTSSKIHNTDLNFTDGKSLYIEKEMDSVPYTFVKSSDYSGNGIDRMINMISFPFTIYRALKKCYKTEKPDVIYTSSPDLFVAFFATIFAKFRKIPLVTEIRDLWPESIVEYNGMSRKNPIIMVLYAMEKWVYKKCDRLIFTMEGGKDYIIDKKWSAVNTDKIRHVNNGVDLEEFDTNISNYTIDDADLNSSDKFKVVYVGSIRQANNVDDLVEVARRLAELGEENIRILVYGDGNQREALEKKCADLGLNNIVFKGRVNKEYVPYVLSKSDLNILNYKQSATWKYGGSQNKQFEYLASGTPICSNVKMGYSIIEANRCGVEENITEIDRYVEIIRQYAAMPKEEYDSQCKRAREAALGYEYDNLGEKIGTVLKEAIESKEN